MEGIRKGICKGEGIRKEACREGLKGKQGESMNGNRDKSRRMQIFRNRFLLSTGGFGMNELLGIAAALIIAGFIVIPGIRGLARDMMEELSEWWDDKIKSEIFSTSVVLYVRQFFPLV